MRRPKNNYQLHQLMHAAAHGIPDRMQLDVKEVVAAALRHTTKYGGNCVRIVHLGKDLTDWRNHAGVSPYLYVAPSSFAVLPRRGSLQYGQVSAGLGWLACCLAGLLALIYYNGLS